MKTAVEKEFDRVSQIFKLLSDVTRLKILLLLEEGELNVTAIATHLDMEQSAVSHQLKLLRENHIVKNRREGKAILYSLDDAHVLTILTKTFDHVRHN
ncbi:ArsR/SmtB family transcription factor [Enterococcus camelliae]|uniref:ArsR/SmtB family transcription factor n=1 Tax=Enterococcus camelliae TaxID=453959 RepID=A0ABW5THU1_9ENTE